MPSEWESKQLIKILLLLTIYEPSIHAITSPVEKNVSSESEEKYAQIKHCLQAKTVLNKYVVDFDVRRQQEIDVFTRVSVIIADSYFSQKRWFIKLKIMMVCFLQTCSFCLLKMLTDGLEWCGSLVDYCDVFISCLDSHSDGTHSLQRIHWWASDGMLHFSKSVPMKKQTHLHLGSPEGEKL